VRLKSSSALWVCMLALLLFPSIGSGQGVPGGSGGETDRIEGRYKIIPLPFINYNRSIGLSLGALPMVMFNPVERDTLSPSSVAGLLGLYSTNKTWFVLGFARVHLDEDKWRLTAAGGLGSVNFQFYLDNPINVWVPYNTRGDFVYAKAERRIFKSIYGGVSYLYMKFRNTTEVFPDTLTTRLHGVGLSAAMDNRSAIYYPRSGFLTDVEYFTYPKAWNEVESNTVDIDYNHYWPFRERNDVIAARAFVGLGIGDLSFNQQYIVGQKDIRGYTQGAHRGNYLLAIQGEYRWNFWRRWGAVGFFGLATVFESINESDEGKILPGIGAGIRFTAFTDNHMNVGIDVAKGDGDWGIYFRIGEAF